MWKLLRKLLIFSCKSLAGAFRRPAESGIGFVNEFSCLEVYSETFRHALHGKIFEPSSISGVFEAKQSYKAQQVRIFEAAFVLGGVCVGELF